MRKIALTGGIGTGKSYISQIFRAMDFPVYSADSEARKFYQHPEVIEKVKDYFGETICIDQKIDLVKLSALVFKDEEKLHYLNSLIHPLVMADFEQWCTQQQSETVFMESAIIFEAALTHFFDMIITVDAPLFTRIARIKQRNPDYSDEHIQHRISSQIEQSIKCHQSDLVILNLEEGSWDIVYRVGERETEQ
jgi:dephospho-CoA kinase